MDNVLIPITAGAALVLVIDFLRKLFPQLTVTWIKLITVAVSILFGAVLLLAQTNQDIAEGFKNFLIILGTSQALYGLVWRDTEVHKDITKEGVQG